VFSFRYHAISLVAVLVALVVGVLLGVAIGDAGLVSSAEQNLRADLREDVGRAEDRAADLESRLDEQRRQAQRYESASYALLVGGRLEDVRVGLLFLGGVSREIRDEVAEAIEPAGARLTGTLAVREPPDVDALAAASGDTRYAAMDEDPSLLDDFGRRIGIQLVQGGKLLRSVAPALFSRRAGRLGPFDAVVVSRRPPTGMNDEQRDQTSDLEDGMMRGLTDNPVSVVGVETADSTPSQVPWYRDRNLSAVDDIETTAGHAALVFALAGARGAFGSGPLAEGLLPPVEDVNG
jgi:hypothetical protein